MLILRRKSGESIVIGDNINVTVLDINEGSVRLAIDAPKVIPILRSELLQAADANRDSAAASHDSLLLLSKNADAARPRALRPRGAKPGRVSAPETPAPEPGQPTETGNPSEPERPTEAGNPAEPEQPTSEPEQPVETENPSAPEQPNA
ncbi:MAG: carbon storage regulator CsrA [Oscillibacter sp.]|nr:carbon storage regulator CsrA [Oscillibacter sp.]